MPKVNEQDYVSLHHKVADLVPGMCFRHSDEGPVMVVEVSHSWRKALLRGAPVTTDEPIQFKLQRENGDEFVNDYTGDLSVTLVAPWEPPLYKKPSVPPIDGSAMPIEVELTYFKPSGKYYTSGEYETRKTRFYEIINEVAIMLLAGNCPGLNDGAVRANMFTTSVNIKREDLEVPHVFTWQALLDYGKKNGVDNS